MTPLHAVVARVTAIEAAVGDRFPLFADRDGRWTTSRRGSWTPGFWVGLLWLRAAVTGAAADLDAARDRARLLLPRAADDTVVRAMTFWHGAAAAERWLSDPVARSVAAEGAAAIVGAFDEDLGAVAVGSAFGGDAHRLDVDTRAAVVALLDWAGAAHLAARHAAGVAPPADKAVRAEAWWLLGGAVAADRLGPTWRPAAVRAAEAWLSTLDGPVPLAVRGEPEAPPDTSAAVIAAAGLWTLGGRFRDAANTIVDSVVADHLSADGALRDGCYDLAGGIAVSHELIWGTYFLGVLLAVRSGVLPAPGW